MSAAGTKGLYIDQWASAAAPEVDGFVLSVGAEGKIGTLYHIAEVRRIVPRPGSTRRLVRYQMRVFKANDLLHPELPHHGLGYDGRNYYVPCGAAYKKAIAITWYKRSKKKQ